jgi:hypothetical protein
MNRRRLIRKVVTSVRTAAKGEPGSQCLFEFMPLWYLLFASLASLKCLPSSAWIHITVKITNDKFSMTNSQSKDPRS